MSSSCFRNNKRGFTLIEVLVGMVLLSSLAIAALQGFKAHKRQLQFAEKKILAVAELDRLLTRMSGSIGGIPSVSAGPLDPQRGWVWQAQPVGQRMVFGQPKLVVRIDALETNLPDARRLASVELLRPVP
jgi:prepilin-type N-terminal cleavage/methylation domain-containing protein